MAKLLILISCLLLNIIIQAQNNSIHLSNGTYLINKKFKQIKNLYIENGRFTFVQPKKIDTVIDLTNKFVITPFGDAHTHNLDGGRGLREMVRDYVNEGVFYVQVLGNYGSGAEAVRPALKRSKKIDATYANGLLTCTYGHGFWPYEPFAMGIFRPVDHIRYADSIRKSRIAENDAYYFLDDTSDVNTKWPLILKYKPDHLKICLLDAANYEKKRNENGVDNQGLSPEVAAYIVKKAHAQGLRVFAHAETADDARLCAHIGVDVLAHLPGYGWNGKKEDQELYCITKKDISLFKKSGITIIPTFNIFHSNEFNEDGSSSFIPERYSAIKKYKTEMLQLLYNAKVPLALGGDYYGKTVRPEIDSLISCNVFSNADLIDLWSRKTSQHIFPERKIGEFKEGYEGSLLIYDENLLLNIKNIYKIKLKIKEGIVLQ